MSRFEYLFRMTEAKFDKDVHVLTGLFDEYAHPIVRMKYPTVQRREIGFGRNIDTDTDTDTDINPEE